jgi:hypothetical protein
MTFATTGLAFFGALFVGAAVFLDEKDSKRE